MKYYEITARINTFFEKDDQSADQVLSNKEVLNEKIQEASEYVDKLEKESGHSITTNRGIVNRRYRFDGPMLNFIKTANDKFNTDNDENNSIVFENIIGHNVMFIAKINDKDYTTILDGFKQKINSIITELNEELLTTRSVKENETGFRRIDEKEYFVSVDINEKEISFKDFYFNGISQAIYYGLDIYYYFKNTNEDSTYINTYVYDNVDKFIVEYDISTDSNKKTFYKKYEELLMNKSFKNEIDRIFAAKNEYKVKINPVHYELSEYKECDRVNQARALAEALYITKRLKKPKMVKININFSNCYFTRDLLQLVLTNCEGSMIFFDFKNTYIEDMPRRIVRSREYNCIGLEEMADNILKFKDDIQFVFYVDKYKTTTKTYIDDALHHLNIVTFDEKLNADKALSYVKSLAKKYNIEVEDKLTNMVEMSKNDITKKDAEDIFDNYKSELIKNKYYPEYRTFFNGIGNVDNYIDPYDKLMNMTGLQNIKDVVNDILTFHKLDVFKKEHLMSNKSKSKIINTKYNGNSMSMHMMFMGNPGTCKTTVAKLVAKILKSRGIIKNDKTIFYGSGIICNMQDYFKLAYGGVLFFDEAYALVPSEIVDLVALMEEYRNDVVVILAGYTNAMKNFIHRNEGLRSRFKYLVEFEDYTEDELWEILKYQAKEENLQIDDSVKEMLMPIFSSCQCDKELGNGRLVRNILDNAMVNQAKRYKDVDLEKEVKDVDELTILKPEDFKLDYKKLTGYDKPRIVGNEDPEIELNNMIGLDNIKGIVRKSIASQCVNKVRSKLLEDENKSFVSIPMHMAFLGNPGTAKTTVARLIARILKKKGIIKKDRIKEVGRKDLVSPFVGNTAPLVKAVFDSAKGGVLFIDEAYSLLEDRQGSFGDEAINTIIAEMENHRDDVIVIFAGYTDRMREFIARNEGLRSRISYTLEFHDYNEKELFEIFKKMLNDEGLIATDKAKKYVKALFADISKDKDYGNGRFVRKFIENAKLNMDERLNNQGIETLNIKDVTTLKESDFKEIENDNVLNEKKSAVIGFAA